MLLKFINSNFAIFPESDSKLRKKQRQTDRLNNFMNKYKATLDKSGSGGSISGSPLEKPSIKKDLYSFVPQDIKYDNKHYKYIKYTKYNKVIIMILGKPLLKHHNSYRTTTSTEKTKTN